MSSWSYQNSAEIFYNIVRQNIQQLNDDISHKLGVYKKEEVTRHDPDYKEGQFINRLIKI